MMVEDQYLQPGSVAWVTESRAEPACFIGDVCIPGDWCWAMSEFAVDVFAHGRARWLYVSVLIVFRVRYLAIP